LFGISIYILLFSIMIRYITTLFPHMRRTGWGILLLGMIELANAVPILQQTVLSERLLFAITSFLVGFGGICVYMQTLSVIQSAGLKGRNILFSKLVQGFFSAAISWLVWPLLPAAHPCLMQSGNLHQANFISFLSLLSIIFLLLLKLTSGNRNKNHI